jgi:hypothetical protein
MVPPPTLVLELINESPIQLQNRTQSMSESSVEGARIGSPVNQILLMLALWLPFFHCCRYVSIYAKDAPWADGIYIYWFLKQAIEGHLDWLQVLNFQHNEHRLGLPYALNVTLAHFTHFNTLFQIYASLVLMAGIVAVLVFFCAKVFRSANVPLIAALPVTWLICSVRQSENLFIALQDLLFMSCFFLVLCLFHASKVSRVGPRIFVSLLFAFASSFSNGNGLLCLPLGGAAIWCNREFRSAPMRTRITLATIWIAGSVLTITAYFWHYDYRGGGMGKLTWPFLKHHPLYPVEFFAAFLASPITYDPGTAVAIGFAFIAAAIIGSVALFKARSELENDVIFPTTLFAYGVISAAMAALGRGQLILVAALSSRYAGFANYAWLGLYLSVLLAKQINQKIRFCVLGALLSLLVMGFLTTTRYEGDQGNSWLDHSLRMENIVRTYHQQGRVALQEVNPDFPDFVVTFSQFLEDNHLSVFSRPVPSLDLVLRKDGQLVEYTYGIDQVNDAPFLSEEGVVPVFTANSAKNPEIFIKGWAKEANTPKHPFAVFFLIDNKLKVLTASGLSRDELLTNQTYAGFGFEGSFRTNLLKPGMHSVQLAIMNKEGTSYCVTPELMRINFVASSQK